MNYALSFFLCGIGFIINLYFRWPKLNQWPTLKSAKKPEKPNSTDDSLARLCEMTALGLSAGLILPEALSFALKAIYEEGPKTNTGIQFLAMELNGLESLRKSGLSFGECLREIEVRTSSERVRQLCARLRFALRIGQELAPCLEALAAEERRCISQAWEERVARLPVLMLFPIAFALLPALFLFLGAPAIIHSAAEHELGSTP